MEDKIKEFWKQKQVVFHHIFLDVMLLIYCIGFYFAANQEVSIRYAVLFVYALLCIVTELVHNRHMQKKYVYISGLRFRISPVIYNQDLFHNAAL